MKRGFVSLGVKVMRYGIPPNSFLSIRDMYCNSTTVNTCNGNELYERYKGVPR